MSEDSVQEDQAPQQTVQAGLTNEQKSSVIATLVALAIIGAGTWFFVHLWDRQAAKAEARRSEWSDRIRKYEAEQSAQWDGVPVRLRNASPGNQVIPVVVHLNSQFSEYKIHSWNRTIPYLNTFVASCTISVRNTVGGWTRMAYVVEFDKDCHILKAGGGPPAN